MGQMMGENLLSCSSMTGCPQSAAVGFGKSSNKASSAFFEKFLLVKVLVWLTCLLPEGLCDDPVLLNPHILILLKDAGFHSGFQDSIPSC